MNFIQINTQTVSGAIYPEKTGKEITVARGVKSPVIMAGYIGAGDVKGNDGEYTPSAYGRLQVAAAKHEDRLVLDISGGLRGVLFKAKEGAKYEYSGVLEDGEYEYPIFGHKRSSERGAFISLSSMERKKREAKGGKPAAQASAKPTDDYDDSDSIPF